MTATNQPNKIQVIINQIAVAVVVILGLMDMIGRDGRREESEES